MSEIQRLLRVAARRNKADEYGTLKLRLLKERIGALKKQLAADGMSANAFVEAVIAGYLERDPAVLAMIDRWREERYPTPLPTPRGLSRREVDEIYAIISGEIDTEEEHVEDPGTIDRP